MPLPFQIISETKRRSETDGAVFESSRQEASISCLPASYCGHVSHQGQVKVLKSSLFSFCCIESVKRVTKTSSCPKVPLGVLERYCMSFMAMLSRIRGVTKSKRSVSNESNENAFGLIDIEWLEGEVTGSSLQINISDA